VKNGKILESGKPVKKKILNQPHLRAKKHR